MKIKNNKGITLITLVITIIILAIIGGVSVRLGINVMQSARFENIETYLMQIKTKTKMMSESVAMGEKDESDLYGTKQTSGTYSGWYKLSQTELNDMGLSKANEEDGYYINYDDEDVAYETGISLDGTTFYKLSDILSYTNK